MVVPGSEGVEAQDGLVRGNQTWWDDVNGTSEKLVSSAESSPFVRGRLRSSSETKFQLLGNNKDVVNEILVILPKKEKQIVSRKRKANLTALKDCIPYFGNK